MAFAVTRCSLTAQAGAKALLGRKVVLTAPIQVAALHATYGGKYPYEKPWPYEQKKFNLLHEYFDIKSGDRLNENSKVIVVDGNIGCGKNDFAERLARNFDLKYIPAVTESDVFWAPNGLDLRIADDVLPEHAQQYTVSKFLGDQKPEVGKGAGLQILFYRARFIQYYRALLHLFHTGQGVVLVRSPFSDRVFAEALRKMGWATKPFLPYYNNFVANSACVLLKPHLTVYVDTPAEVCYENIQKRAKEEEKGKRNMTMDYLNTIQSIYKEKHLPQARATQEVVEIDWSEVGDDMDMEVIAEELSLLDLESSHPDDPKFQEWTDKTEDRLGHYRKLFGSDWQMQNLLEQRVPWECPEIIGDPESNALHTKYVFEHPAIKYDRGYRREFGDNVLFKF